MGSSVLLPPPGQPKEGPDPNFTSGSVPNFVSFQLQNVAPPSNAYIQRDDFMVVNGQTSAVNEVVTISGRILLANAPFYGQPKTSGEAQTPPQVYPGSYIQAFGGTINFGASTYTNVSISIPLAEGYLLSVDARANVAGSPGQTYINGTLNRGKFVAGVQNDVYRKLFASYLTTGQVFGWPDPRMQMAPEGVGWLHVYTVANPAAGTDWIFTVGNGRRLRIISFNALLTTSAVAGTRYVQLIMDDGVNAFFAGQSTQGIPASTAANVCGTTNIVQPAAGATPNVMVPIPSGQDLPFSFRMRTATAGILAGDQWSNIFIFAEEWIDQT